ncbi:MmgE/PrpD family protein [Amycolatopsis acidicola]|uniref:MmgE/PrpD family protein n=1 Tax=Amycolatopsis acidicola TaxID=2596893 RepID=A0A5N0VCT3_9PSEU|nr:MmgE/PrpD family protein [Amycolatopsis acidicola]KAA9163294.1 MmgE/PrpD family protein [Amycolatopsis acidicola]
MSIEEDFSRVLARHVVSAGFDDLTPESVTAAKQSTLDTIGVILGGGGQMAAIPGVVDLVKDWSGKPESTILGFGGKVPCVDAAFVNGAMAHGLDYDDHLPEGHHPSSATVPALLALSERLGGASGKDFLTALALGQDIFARIRTNIETKQDWHLTPVIATYTTAAACAKLLGLDEEQTVDALGIAFSQLGGTFELAYGVGHDLRGMYAGFSAKAGLFSALLAETGVSGIKTSFEGSAGFMNVYFGGKWDRAGMLAGLGEDFRGSTIVYKPWPSCGASHPYVHTVLGLAPKIGSVDHIEKIEVFGGDFAKRLSEPAERRRHPATVLDAKFSIPYTIALALARGTVSLGDFDEASRTDPAVGAIADKIEFVDDPKYNWTSSLPTGAVRVTLRGGETLFTETSHDETPGSTSNPLSWDDLVAKFDDCCGYAGRELKPGAREKLIEQTRVLEQVSDVSALPALFG